MLETVMIYSSCSSKGCFVEIITSEYLASVTGVSLNKSKHVKVVKCTEYISTLTSF